MLFFVQPIVQRSPILLTGSSTGHAWNALVIDTATVQDIWHYINHSMPSKKLRSLPEPMAPIIAAAVGDPANTIYLYSLQDQVYPTEVEQYKAVQLHMLRSQE